MRFLITSVVIMVLFAGTSHAKQEWQVLEPSQTDSANGSYYAQPEINLPQRVQNKFVPTQQAVPDPVHRVAANPEPPKALVDVVTTNITAPIPVPNYGQYYADQPGVTVIEPPKNCWQNRIAKTGEYRDPNSTLPIPFAAKLVRAYGCNKHNLDIHRKKRDPRFFFGVDPATCCDEWDLFAGCGGLKANPGHWGRPWIRAADDVCMECRYCRCKKNHREKKAYRRGEVCGCESCGSPSSGGCSTCEAEPSTNVRIAELFETEESDTGIFGKLFKK